MTRTTLFTALCVGIRLGGIFVMVEALLEVPAILPFLAQDHDPAWAAIGFIAIAFIFLIGFWLWLYPGVLARLAVGKAAHESIESGIDSRDLQYVGFSLLGMWFLVTGIVNQLWNARTFWTGAYARYENLPLWVNEAIMNIAADGILVIVGLALVLGANGLSAFLHRLRYARTSGRAGRGGPGAGI